MPAALLFDLDGTLIHSDPIHVEVFGDLYRERGRPFEAADYYRHIHGRENVAIFSEAFPDEDPHALSDEKEARFRDRLARIEAPIMPGAAALMTRATAAGWSIAIVTNAPRDNAHAMLSALGLSDHAQELVIGGECARAKPDPLPYQEAMRRLGVTPDRALAFEDSPSGARAARGSGAYTIGIRSSLDDHALRQAGAHLTLEDFTDPALEPALARLTDETGAYPT
ncbi:haloacid dehalogenase superfamily, subfamily IA, variant 3 with third motif having DD or ED [Roseivivax lentus]|uniref:Haloacid dehalogenase superfamily, subfamily IA, variant 3 with third motif having DD or ED n=1 Tax=Roseivivax lentus TaxID=633194 RepID=A0A1N7LUF2_9RHOB|nr:HAD-IA family hydrolase [Roseivivax lentus]SIS77402.1 haloacid dehalogenase superfamily, subfamily IA, variant 3 with third motif having DD or ED [Roseivivax lentus]